MKQSFAFLFILIAMNAAAQQSNVHFSHTVITTASREAIWKIWTDVPNWKVWDSGLKEAVLLDIFRNGAKGNLVPLKGPKAKFRIDDVVPFESYTLKTKIPFGWLLVKRSMKESSGQLAFTHEVMFTGLLRKPLSNKLGKDFKAMLPAVMNTIKQLAER